MNNVKEFFDSVASSWDKRERKSYDELNSFIKEYVPIKEGMKALDLACGTGIITNILYNITNREIDAVDISSEMIKCAISKNNNPNIHFICDDFLNINGEYDIIVAPTNLGSIFYNKNQGEKYVLYQTIVWGNLYVVCDEEITSFSDLANKEITLFGQNSTPDIVMKSLASYYNISFNPTYVSDVTASTSAYVSGTSKCVVSAQPVLTKLNAKLKNAYVLDLQAEWAKMTSSASYPQASIFFKASLKGKIDNVLLAMTESVKKANENPATTAENATTMYQGFETLGKDVLENAIPKCHYAIEENQKEAIEFYFNKMKELSLDAQFGGKLPDENFYYSI